MANRDEVEEFLRRAAARRAAAQQQQPPQARPPAPPAPQWTPPPQPQQFQPQQFQQQPFQQQPFQPRRPATLAEVVMLEPVDAVEAELIEVELADQTDRVGRSVEMHMRGTQQIAAHTEQLGDEIELADDKLEQHLHQVFDHKVGDLKKSTMEPAASSPSLGAQPAPPPAGASIAQLLASPQNLRSAFILSEVLKRPEENW
jgi:hypothetical protein